MHSLDEAGFDELARTLRAEHLPSEHLRAAHRRFFGFTTTTGERIGFAGLELFRTEALLRSVVVAKSLRGHGYGAAIVSRTLEEARQQGVRRVYLLTAGAAPFFARLGFARIDRQEAPAAITGTDEFTALCPVTAELMMRVLS